MAGEKLWSFFQELRRAVEEGNAGGTPQPYRAGEFMVLAEAEDIELTVRDVTEEDAVLIAGELRNEGARAVVRGQVVCPQCGLRVPEQAYCIGCRAPLEIDAESRASAGDDPSGEDVPGDDPSDAGPPGDDSPDEDGDAPARD